MNRHKESLSTLYEEGTSRPKTGFHQRPHGEPISWLELLTGTWAIGEQLYHYKSRPRVDFLCEAALLKNPTSVFHLLPTSPALQAHEQLGWVGDSDDWEVRWESPGPSLPISRRNVNSLLPWPQSWLSPVCSDLEDAVSRDSDLLWVITAVHDISNLIVFRWIPLPPSSIPACSVPCVINTSNSKLFCIASGDDFFSYCFS